MEPARLAHPVRILPNCPRQATTLGGFTIVVVLAVFWMANDGRDVMAPEPFRATAPSLRRHVRNRPA